jgi:hypothetical protein
MLKTSKCCTTNINPDPQTWAWVKRETIQALQWRISIQGDFGWMDTQVLRWMGGFSIG